MRLLFDLFSCRGDATDSPWTQQCLALARALTAEPGEHELRLLVNGLVPDAVAALRRTFQGLLPPGALSSYTHPEHTWPESEDVAAGVIHAACQAVRADAILYADPFQSPSHPGLPALPHPDLPAGLRIVLLHGVPPALRPAGHLVAEDRYGAWHADRLARLAQADLILVLDEEVRAEALNALDIAPQSVVNIAAGEAAGKLAWEGRAQRAWEAIGGALAAGSRTPTALRIAVVAPPQRDDATSAILAALAQYHTLTPFELVPDTVAGAPVAGSAGIDLVLYVADESALAPALVHRMRAAPGVLWLTGRGADAIHTADPALILRDGGVQGLQRWLSSGAVPPPGRSVHEALYLLIHHDAFEAAALRRRYGGALPPLATLDAATATPARHAQRLAELLVLAHMHDWRHAAAHIAACWRGTGNDTGNDTGHHPGPAELALVAAHAQANLMNSRAPRLLIDVSQLALTDAASGIQRVVRNIARELCLLDDEALPPIELVRLREGALHRAGTVIAQLFGYPARGLPDAVIDIHPGDLLLMIDSSWDQCLDFLPVFDTVHRLGGRVVSVVYDLIPLRLPEFCDAVLADVFRRWLELAVRKSDMLLCISQAVQDEVAAYLDNHGAGPHRPQLAHWPLGADIVPGAGETAVRPEVAAMVADPDSPLFLMVGTIEPRKGHTVVLDAFDALWAAGGTERLCLAGKEGWRVQEVMQRIRSHPQLGRRLFFIERFTDAEIALCYRHAHALLAPSIAEGYGLPIVEAALHQVPTIASDIPVFREVAGDGAAYFPVGDAAALATAIRRFSTFDLVERQRMAAQVKLVSWRASARQAWQILAEMQCITSTC